MKAVTAQVDDPQAGQIWFVRDLDNLWYLAKVKAVKGALVDIVYGDGTPERFNLKRHASGVFLADSSVKLSAKSYTTQQVKKLSGHEVQDEDPEWLEAMEGSPAEQLKYLAKQWRMFNKLKFQGKMHQPNLTLIRVSSRVRGLGRWRFWVGAQEKNTLSISPRTFLLGKESFEETLLHEMCHQWCSDVLSLTDEGHGAHWKAIMRRIGLNPERLANSDSTVLYTDDELEERQERLNVADQLNKKYGPVLVPLVGRIVSWAGSKPGTQSQGVLVAPTVKTGEKWAVVSDPSGASYVIVHVSSMYNTQYGDTLWRDIPEFRNLGDKIRLVYNHVELTKANRSVRQQNRHNYRYD